MKYTKEQVFQLFVEKLSGSISPEEAHVVEERLRSDTAFEKDWRYLEEKASRLGVAEFLSGLNAAEGLEELKERLDAAKGDGFGKGDGFEEGDGFKKRVGFREEDDFGERVGFGEEDGFGKRVDFREEDGFMRRVGFRKSVGSGEEVGFKKRVVFGKSVGFRKMLVAAVLLVAVAGAWMLLTRKERVEDRGRIAEMVKERQQTVRLSFGSVRTVDLGKAGAGKSIALGNTTLNTGRDALQYTSGDTTTSTLSVPPGANYKIVLSDGTEVWLNADTRLRFPLKFPSGSREVQVEGEAYFKVAGNAHAPFIVHTPLTDVKVLGTSFNINTYEKGNVRTALVEGKVIASRPGGQEMPLSPGYVAEYQVSNGFTSATFEQDDELAWINGVYYFHDMSVEGLVRLASRCYGIHIVVDKEGLGGQRLTGIMERGKLPEFLNDLATTAHIKYYYSNNDLHLE